MFGHLTYLVFELVWALPVILGQWIIGWYVLHRAWRFLAVGALVPTVYFSTADSIAIHAHIWTLNPSRIVGLHLGTLPLEEAVFFLLTNLMVVQGLLLLGSAEQWVRARRLLTRLRSAMRGRPRSSERVAAPHQAGRVQQSGSE